jgi:transcription elongation factor Elf1
VAEVSELVLALDRQQRHDNPRRVICPHGGVSKSVSAKRGDATFPHGGLGVHVSGTVLVCGTCGYQVAASLRED